MGHEDGSHRQLVVCSRRCEHRALIWAPLDARDGLLVKGKVRDLPVPAERAEVPDAQRAVVGAARQHVGHQLVPADHIDVRTMRLRVEGS